MKHLIVICALTLSSAAFACDCDKDAAAGKNTDKKAATCEKGKSCGCKDSHSNGKDGKTCSDQKQKS